MAVFVDQWSTTKNIQTHIRVVTEYTYIFDSINITCVISSSHRIPLSHETHDNKLATHRNVCAMSSEAVVMVLVDRKSEASTKLWTVGSKLCGGWRKKEGWMLGSLHFGIIVIGQRECELKNRMDRLEFIGGWKRMREC